MHEEVDFQSCHVVIYNNENALLSRAIINYYSLFASKEETVIKHAISLQANPQIDVRPGPIKTTKPRSAQNSLSYKALLYRPSSF